MSYAQRRRFPWLLFLAGLLLIAMTARATTLVRLRFPDLVHYASAIARVRCVGADTRVENGEIFTDTRFHVLESEKGRLPASIVVRQPGGKFQHLYSHVEGAPEFRIGEEVYLFLWGRPEGSSMCWAGRRERFACTATRSPARKPSRRIPPKCPSLIPRRMPSRRWVSKTSGSMCFRSVYAAKFCARCPRELSWRTKSFIHELGYGSEVNERDGRKARQKQTMRVTVRKLGAIGVAALYGLWSVVAAHGYAFNEIVPDVRQPVSVSGGSACPVHAHQLTGAGSLSFRWSTVLGSNPTTILTQNQTPTGSLNEIEQTVQQSLSVWTNVSGTTLTPASLAPLTRISSANVCSVDGINSICFDQPDMAFTPGVLAFTRVVTADTIGIQVGSGPFPRNLARSLTLISISIPAIL